MCEALSKEDVVTIHIAPAHDRRGEQGCTYLIYKIGDAFILHYPGKVRRERGKDVEVIYLGWLR